VIGRTQGTRVLAGLAALGLALTAIGPAAAQTAPSLSGGWTAAPGAGANTIVGRVETPRSGQTVTNVANLLVSGWAADSTAAGWSGISGVEVWNGTKDKGTKLSTGSVGLARPDIGDALGAGTFGKSGFSAVVPASALQQANAGSNTLYIYLNTPGKGSFYRSVSVNLTAPVAAQFATDPIIQITKPQDGTSITQLQRNNSFSFSGFALDRNPPDPNFPGMGPGCSGCRGTQGFIGTQARGAGIQNVIGYLDQRPSRSDVTPFGNFGTPCGAACLYGNILVSNAGSINVPRRPQASIITRQYGSQFDFAGWSLNINPTTISPGWHTLYVTATSANTPAVAGCSILVCGGKQTTASVTFQMLDMSHKKIQP
jgi:hypothetical protein